MFIILKILKHSLNPTNNISIINSSIPKDLENLLCSTLKKRIDAETFIEKLNQTVFSISYENKSYFAFVDTRIDIIIDYVILSILLDDSSTFIELFQNEIKQYLDKILAFKSELSQTKLDWKTHCIFYLPKFIKLFKPILPEIIFGAIQGFKFIFKNISEHDIEQINRFSLCFEILDIKDNQKSDNASQLVISKINEVIMCNLKTSTDSCNNISNKLFENEDPIILKSIINDFILEINKELNNVRRMLNRAVGDFYFNYQLYRFILASDKREILHHHLQLNDDISLKEMRVLNLTFNLIKEK